MQFFIDTMRHAYLRMHYDLLLLLLLSCDSCISRIAQHSNKCIQRHWIHARRKNPVKLLKNEFSSTADLRLFQNKRSCSELFQSLLYVRRL